MADDMLIDEIRDVQRRLNVTRNHFEFAADEDEIASLIYEEKAYMLRLSYLLRQAKALGNRGMGNG